MASKTSKIAAGMLPKSALGGGSVGSSAAGQEGTASGSLTPTPTPTPVAGLGLPLKGGGLCSYPNQKGKDGKRHWQP